MAIIEDVPLLVWERLKYKWDKIKSPNDGRIDSPCAMCNWMCSYCSACPIWSICGDLLNDSRTKWVLARRDLVTLCDEQIERISSR